jgi:hypothetical protein
MLVPLLEAGPVIVVLALLATVPMLFSNRDTVPGVEAPPLFVNRTTPISL